MLLTGLISSVETQYPGSLVTHGGVREWRGKGVEGGAETELIHCYYSQLAKGG